MIFAENTQVIYKGMYGVIDFVCDSYVVVQIPNADPKYNPARLLVYRDCYEKIELYKGSTK